MLLSIQALSMAVFAPMLGDYMDNSPFVMQLSMGLRHVSQEEG